MRDPSLQNTIGTQADGMETTLGFQHLVEARNGEGGIRPEEPHQVSVRVSRNDRLQDRLPSIGAVNIAGAQSAAFQMTELVEDEKRVIAHAAEMAVL